MLRLLAVLVAAYLAAAPLPAYAAGVTWERWKTFPGVFDVDGSRSDGSLIVAGSAALYLVDPAGAVTPFARGPGGYHQDAGAEAYLAVSQGRHVGAANCSFVRNETFLLRLQNPMGITRVTASGDSVSSFAKLTGVTSLNGIAFATTGTFDNRLLVSGPSRGKTTIFAIDCNGLVQVITRSAPVLEGGLAVAPSTFGSFGGELIAPDELSGNIYAIAATGAVSIVAKPALPIGPDTGVEGVGFVPPGFTSRGGSIYYADRGTPKNPHPGTNSLLRLSSSQLVAAGVKDGDLLAAVEGGARLVAVHCEFSCPVIPLVATATTAHGEGHIAFTLGLAPPSPSPTPTTPSSQLSPSRPSQQAPINGGRVIPTIAVVVLLALLAFFGVQAVRRRRR